MNLPCSRAAVYNATGSDVVARIVKKSHASFAVTVFRSDSFDTISFPYFTFPRVLLKQTDQLNKCDILCATPRQRVTVPLLS